MLAVCIETEKYLIFINQYRFFNTKVLISKLRNKTVIKKTNVLLFIMSVPVKYFGSLNSITQTFKKKMNTKKVFSNTILLKYLNLIFKDGEI